MVFSSTLFLFLFLPLTLAGYCLFPGRSKNVWLFLVSLVFFSWSQPQYLWIILVSILINYAGALLISRLPAGKGQKAALTVSVILNLAILFYYKYFDFTIASVNQIFGSKIPLKEIVLPIGISFFTFQGMSYVIDVYRKDVPVQKSLMKLGLYIVLFPQLIAGPIVRYKDIAAEIDRRHTSLEDFCDGLERFIIGLGKKAIIANTMAAAADAIWANGAGQNAVSIAWLGSIAYSLQIFFDFSGYSDMAIGLGRIFGFHFNENFDLPYISKSITEFWRRWHISLSSWFRDYVYIPLGGNRRGNVYLHLWTVFLLTGIWHGASWHYLVWGIWHGLFIFVERLLNRDRHFLPDEHTPGARKLLFRIYTLLTVNFGWVLFRADNTKDAVKYLANMFGLLRPKAPGYTIFWYLDRWTAVVLLCGIFFSTGLPAAAAGKLKELIPGPVFLVLKYLVLLCLLLLCMMRIVSGTYNPFIYFQF